MRLHRDADITWCQLQVVMAEKASSDKLSALTSLSECKQ